MSEAKTENSLESLREEKSWLRFSRLSRTDSGVHEY
jgi:tRNA U38,U39,U40 pseudouridine synthase TruA